MVQRMRIKQRSLEIENFSEKKSSDVCDGENRHFVLGDRREIPFGAFVCEQLID